ncbi:unnamed protein product [Rhizopus stolonifer]
MASLVSCAGIHNQDIVFVSKNNQTDDYLLHYLNLNQTLIYSNTLSTIQGYPSHANFTGSCSYDNTQSSFLMVFESFNQTVNSTTSSIFSQLQPSINPLFTNQTILLDTQVVSAITMATVNTTQIAFVSERLQGHTELSLNLLNGGTLTKLTTLNQTGILASDAQSNSLYLLQNNLISDYQLTNQTYDSFAVSSSITRSTSASVVSSANNQTKYIFFYDQQNAQVNLYQHIPSLSQSVALNHSLTSIHVDRVTQIKPTVTSAKGLQKRDVSGWTERRVSQTGCSNGQCIVSVVALAGEDEPSLIMIVDEGNGTFSAMRILQTTSSTAISTATSTPSNTPSDTSLRNESSRLSDGGIAGIVVGVLVFVAIVAGLLWFIKRKKNKIRSYKTRNYSFEEPVPAQSVIISHSILRAMSSTSVIYGSEDMISTQNDGRPDIRPLSYIEGLIDFAHLSDEEMLELEPERGEPMVLFNGAYISPKEEQVHHTQVYTTRTFMTQEGYCSVHYFTSAHLDTFVRAVHAVSIQDSSHVMKTQRAIVLYSPTPKSGYQSLWITSPTLASHTLYAVLSNTPNLDPVITTWSLLQAVHSVHKQGLVHLSIDTHAFYQTPSLDWILGNFGTVQKQGTPLTRDGLPTPNAFTPPEFHKTFLHQATTEADLWSLGCVIYTLITQKNVGARLDEEQLKEMLNHVKDQAFRTLLNGMLQLSPKDRKSIQFALDTWNAIYHLQ